MEKMEIVAKNSRKWHFERNKNNEGDVVLLTNWISILSLRNHTIKERNQRKEQGIKLLRDMILKK